ncbi:MAG: tetratricopeptide repeat protein [Planctomycetota bacterium]|jgi:hypothetical protein
MMKRYHLSRILVPFLLVFSGCAPVVYVGTFLPPKTNVAGIHTLAVVTFNERFDRDKYQTARLVADRLAAALDESYLYDGVRQRVDYGRALDMKFDSHGFPLPEDALKLQSELKVDAIMMVRVLQADAYIHRSPGHMSYGVYGGGPHSSVGMRFNDYDTYYIGGTLVAKFRMVANGQIIAQPPVPKQVLRDRANWGVSSSEIFEILANGAVGDFIPHVDVVTARRRRVLMSGSEGAIKDGIGAAMSDRWEKARGIWLETAAAFPDNPASFYNLGVAAEVAEDFTDALDYYLSARDLTGSARAFEHEIEEAELSIKAFRLIEATRGEKLLQEPAEKTVVEEQEGVLKKSGTVPTPDEPENDGWGDDDLDNDGDVPDEKEQPEKKPDK